MEEKIISLLEARNSIAISLLYDNYAAALFGVILKIVQSNELAEQVLQDTFIKVWKNSDKFDKSRGRLFTWMVNIARNTAIDATRSTHYKYFKKTNDLDTLVSLQSRNAISPEQVGLRQLVDHLEDKYRTLIEKIYFEGYTQREIEKELDIPIGTVKTRLRHAIKELRSKFND
ncbi:MAG TPA: sigma-70 family RNA polymerase sigma factor [Saprospiraceae bacterium]|nr:sigma-70 family RNA polymerase sigma factor [Saprospiraceae bacterium]